MSPKTATLPPSEPLRWRKLLSKVHPDAGGDHELFIWAMNLRELVCERGLPSRTVASPPPPPPKGSAERDRVALDGTANFSRLLRPLLDCEGNRSGKERSQQHRGASHRQLALVAHRAGMTSSQRRQWYELAERIPLSMQHASHIIEKMGGDRDARTGPRQGQRPRCDLVSVGAELPRAAQGRAPGFMAALAPRACCRPGGDGHTAGRGAPRKSKSPRSRGRGYPYCLPWPMLYWRFLLQTAQY
jgi:hypothetical protein